MNMLFKANPHKSEGVNRRRMLYLHLSAVFVFLGACADIYVDYLQGELAHDNSVATTLNAITIVDEVLWLIISVAFLSVIFVAKSGLRERVRDVVDRKPLFDCQAAGAGSANRGSISSPSAPFPSRKMSVVEPPVVDYQRKVYDNGTDEKLLATLNGAIWTLTALWWSVACYVLYSISFGVAVMIVGYPSWMYFANVLFNYAYVLYVWPVYYCVS
ncbi:hypothetical protein HK101_002755 [Irineochytrium annulatum]|nr:hypothetical protein HK101_002755 [Irineochytrium annulatum]